MSRFPVFRSEEDLRDRRKAHDNHLLEATLIRLSIISHLWVITTTTLTRAPQVCHTLLGLPYPLYQRYLLHLFSTPCCPKDTPVKACQLRLLHFFMGPCLFQTP